MNKSFTLIEILVVIVIVGVLSAFILVGMSSITTSANFAKGKAFFNSMDNSLLLARVSQWKLDEASGITAYDSWGTNDGTRTDATGACDATHCPQIQTTGCPSGNCLSFDGTNDYVSTNSGWDSSLSTTLTISAWVKITGGIQGVVLGQNTAIPPRKFLFYVSNTNRPSFQWSLDGGGTNVDVSFANIIDTNWQNIVVTFNNGVVVFYTNGVVSGGKTSLITSIEGTAGGLRIGRDLWSGFYYSGLIDDVRIYKQAIPTSQIKQNYFIVLNKLFKNKGTTLNEFNQRIVELKSSLVNNR